MIEKMSNPASINSFNYHRQSGALIVLVLVLLALLSVLSLVILGRVEEQIRLRVAFDKPQTVPFRLESGLEIALAALDKWRREEGAWRATSEEWADPLRYLDISELPEGLQGVIVIQLEDAAGRFPFRSMEEEDFSNLLRSVSRDTRQVNRFVDRLLDWMDEDDFRRPEGAEFPEYGFRMRDRLRLPPNRRIENRWEWEFFLSEGLDDSFEPEFVRMVSGLFHFYPANGINVNTAPEAVLRTMGEMSGANVSSLLSYRERQGSGLRGRGGIIDDASRYFPRSGGRERVNPVAEIEVFRVRVELVGSGGHSQEWIVLPGDPGDAATGRSHPAGFFIMPPD